MANKIRVYGKAMNRTALGIINAYLVLYPQATLDDLRKAFPNSLNPSIPGNLKEMLRTVEEAQELKKTVTAVGYLDATEDIMHLQDGTQVVLVSMWTKDGFEKLVNHASQYGIEVAKVEKAEMGGVKGSYRLEFLNDFAPQSPTTKEKKGVPRWVRLILALIVIVIILFFYDKCRKPKEIIIEKETIVTVVDTAYVNVVDTAYITVVDTVVINQLAAFEADFNAAQYAQGSAELSEKAKEVLRDLARYLKTNGQYKLTIVGHTSAEGSVAYNQKLSEDRARGAANYLIEQGIPEERVSYVGKGSSEPIDPDNLDVNRRTEFLVTQIEE